MTPKTQAELDELHLTEEQLRERTEAAERMARGDDNGSARIAGDNAMQQQTQTSTPETRTRKTRSDAGKERGPRIYIDAPGVRFDLMHVEGRASFKYWISRTFQEGGAMFGNAAIDELLAHIDRLVAKEK